MKTILVSVTGALWAKRGEHGILPEAWDEGEENVFFLLPSSGDSHFA